MSLAACGGGGSDGGGSTAGPGGGGTPATPTGDGAVRASAPAGPGAAGSAAGGAPADKPIGTKACRARLANFLDRMDDLRQALVAGLSYDEYVVRVRAIRAAYEAVPVGKLGVACVSGPAAEAEDAFNQYLRAANAWGDCAATAGCAASEVEGKLQRHWRIASQQLDAAEHRR